MPEPRYYLEIGDRQSKKALQVSYHDEWKLREGVMMVSKLIEEHGFDAIIEASKKYLRVEPYTPPVASPKTPTGTDVAEAAPVP